jgi:ABC-type sugar transport system ATPase subunit
VQILDKKHRFPRELSGGEQQRVSIARAIVKIQSGFKNYYSYVFYIAKKK